MLSFSEAFDDLCPPESGIVRAELILGGYVMTPVSHSETLMQYVVQVLVSCVTTCFVAALCLFGLELAALYFVCNYRTSSCTF